MRKLIIAAIVIFTNIITAIAQDVEYTIIRKLNGDIAYSDADGLYLSREAWIEKYGRKVFSEKFPYPYIYNHAEEVNYIRKDVANSIRKGNGETIEWSRVFTTDGTIEQTKIAAKQRIPNITHEDGNVIIGTIVDVVIKPDVTGKFGIASGLYNSALSATVKYEFKDGRYRVTAYDIKSKLTIDISVGVMSGSLYLGSHGEDPYNSVYDKFYKGGIKASDERWLKLSNTIDYNLSTLLRLEIETPDDNW